MEEEIQKSNRKRRLTLKCSALSLEIEFGLGRGEFARIGASSFMEITLPMVGIRGEECRLLCDDEGILWLTIAESDCTNELVVPTGFQIGPYHFALSERGHLPAPEVPAKVQTLTVVEVATM